MSTFQKYRLAALPSDLRLVASCIIRCERMHNQLRLRCTLAASHVSCTVDTVMLRCLRLHSSFTMFEKSVGRFIVIEMCELCKEWLSTNQDSKYKHNIVVKSL